MMILITMKYFKLRKAPTKCPFASKRGVAKCFWQLPLTKELRLQLPTASFLLEYTLLNI